MTVDAHSVADRLAKGRDALARGAWAEARECFAGAVQDDDSGEAWEGLGWAGYRLHEAELTVGSRERAYQAYRRSGDMCGAGRVAAWLAADFHEFRGDDAIAGGWLERAHRLLDDLSPGADHGWLALIEGSFELGARGDLSEVIRLAGAAARIGRRCAVPDLEAIGLSLEGFALVGQARVAEGVRRLDEASAIATGEDLQLPISPGWALCYVIAACEAVGDFPRATQWCEVMRASSERWGARHLRGVCRSTYGTVLVCCGDWEGAETELTKAIGDLAAVRPGMVGGGLVRLGELPGLAKAVRRMPASCSSGPEPIGRRCWDLGVSRSTRAIRKAQRTQPSACCAVCPPSTSWDESPDSSCSPTLARSWASWRRRPKHPASFSAPPWP